MFDDLKCGNMVAVLLSRPLEEEEEGEEKEEDKKKIRNNLLQAECGVNAAQVGYRMAQHLKAPQNIQNIPSHPPQMSRNEYK